MQNERTTIMTHPILMKRVANHIKNTGENLSEFYNRAILNQLEKDGDWDIRDLLNEATEGNV